MAGRRQALPLRNHPGPAEFNLKARTDHCISSRAHGIVKTRRASGETGPLRGTQRSGVLRPDDAYRRSG